MTQAAESGLCDSQGCTHPSLDGLAGTDILVCMSCHRLVRRFGYMEHDNIPLTGYHDLNCIEVKALFRGLEIAKEAEIAALMHDANSALSQAEAAARAYQDDLRDARAEARYGR